MISILTPKTLYEQNIELTLAHFETDSDTAIACISRSETKSLISTP